MKPKVCLDPGHGGHDSGATGPNGLLEKDVVLAVALSLRELLEPAVDVVMTRETDRFIALPVRAEMANFAQARVFVSIHCNAAERATCGIETWHFRGSVRGAKLAGELQDAMLCRFPQSTDRGIKGGGFHVLRETAMPAALAELEFIHTATGEELLGDALIQATYADALADGILTYLGIELGAGAPRFAAAKPEPHPLRRDIMRVIYRTFGKEERQA